MKCREFVYVGEPSPKITEQEHTAFLLQLQKSMLASLEKRELLNHSQYERCVAEIENQYHKKIEAKTTRPASYRPEGELICQQTGMNA